MTSAVAHSRRHLQGDEVAEQLASVERDITVDRAVRLRLQGKRFHEIASDLGVSDKVAATYVQEGLKTLRRRYREGTAATARRVAELLVGFDELQRLTLELLDKASHVGEKISVLSLAKGLLQAKAKTMVDLGLVRPVAASPPQQTVNNYAYLNMIPENERKLVAKRLIDEQLKELSPPEPFTP